ncbi:MAG: hypothetical protein KBD37_00445 [Burkholderiales bacterium]|nr:hypothetical protein [Burkholderiales bacterium]
MKGNNDSDTIEQLLQKSIDEKIEEFLEKIGEEDNTGGLDVKLLHKYLSSCKNHTLGSDKDIFKQIMNLGAVKSQCEMMQNSAKISINNIISTIASWALGTISRLLSLISKYLTLKGWSISGDAGVNLGIFTAGAKLKLDF